MNLPNWFKIGWWIVITGGLSRYLWLRMDPMLAGDSQLLDIVVFLVWLALMLVPLFNEIDLWGLKLKSEIEEVKTHVSAEIEGLRSEITNKIDLQTTFNPTFNFPYPHAGAQLENLKEHISAELEAALMERGISADEQPTSLSWVDDDTTKLFAARYATEKELRRIWLNHTPDDERRRPRPAIMIATELYKKGIIDGRTHGAVREIYSVTSPAIHGEEPRADWIKFVEAVTPELLALLKDID